MKSHESQKIVEQHLQSAKGKNCQPRILYSASISLEKESEADILLQCQQILTGRKAKQALQDEGKLYQREAWDLQEGIKNISKGKYLGKCIKLFFPFYFFKIRRII